MSVYSRGWQRRRLSAAGRLAAASGNHSGNHAQVPIEDLKCCVQILAPPQCFASGEYHLLDRAAAALLGNGVERCVVGVAEHREDRRAADLVDGIVAPLAAGDVAAVEGEQLIQFAPVEENPPRAFAVLTETIELAHASGRAPFASRFRRLVARRSEEHTSELQSLMRISYAV